MTIRLFTYSLQEAETNHAHYFHNGVQLPVNKAAVIPDGDTLEIHADTGWRFTPATLPKISLSSGYQTMTPQDDIIKVCSIVADSSMSEPVTGSIVTEAWDEPVPLAWVDHPESGNAGDDIIYSWTGKADAFTFTVKQGEDVIVNEQVAANTYTINLPDAGNYTVSVSDGTDTIEQALTLETAYTPLAWNGEQPTTVIQGEPALYKWKDGEPASTGYKFLVLNDVRDTIFSTNVDGLEYSYSFENTGDFSVQIQDSHGLDTAIEKAVTVNPVPITLEWEGEQPSTSTTGQEVTFKWKGNAANYNAVITNSKSEEVYNKTITGNSLKYTFNDADKYTVSISDSSTTIRTDIIVNALPVYVYTFTEADIEMLTRSLVSLTARGEAVTVGLSVQAGDELQAVCDASREFYNVSGQGTSIRFFNGIGEVLNFTISEDLRHAVGIMKAVNDAGYPWEFTCDTHQADSVSGTNNVYLVNRQIMDTLNYDRFQTGSSSDQDIVDFGQYILGLIELPFKIDDSLILEEENIQLATLKTKAVAPKVSTDKITLDLGSITVPPKHNNLLDYANTTAVLRLPRMTAVNIDIDYIIGKTINIQYIIDCYSGEATVNVISSETGESIISNKVNLAINIPYANLNSPGVDNSNIDIVGDNGITTPFIELLKNEALLTDGEFTIPITDEKVIGEQKGFIKVEEIELKTNALGNEKRDILRALQDGVIIK